jgi:GntR family transcriptional regulator
MMLDRNSPLPLHAQLEEIIKAGIENEEWPFESVIPSENELSKMYGISRMTVRSVITRLVHEGLLYSVPGKGTFVSEPKIVSRPLSQMGIREQLSRWAIRRRRS